MAGEARKAIVLALAGVFGGFAIVVALFGTGQLLRHDRAAPAQDQHSRTEPPTGEAGEREASKPQASKPEAFHADPDRPLQAQNRDAASAEGGGDPTFDIVRVEADGAAVVAGRAAPHATVELLRDGRSIATAIADAAGQFVMVPPSLPAGSGAIGLRARDPDGRVRTGGQSVTVVVAERRDTKPLVALSAPDRPTVVLSQPDAPDAVSRTANAQPAADKPRDLAGSGKLAPVRVVSVDAHEGGRLDVTGQAQPGSSLRLYLNDTIVAAGRAGADGRVAFTIGRGVRPGAYRIRIDQVDLPGGKVRHRSEVAFAYPETGARAVAAREGAAGAAPAATPAGTGRIQGSPVSGSLAALDASARPSPTPPGAGRPEGGAASVFVPEINTSRITRGDSLWQISRRIYGKGTRYTVIYDANREQIRDPHRIYPGQIFVLPKDGPARDNPASAEPAADGQGAGRG